ncbi:MAG: hypothetical protein JW751_02575 [Polyangiaceae bacterium]|nr:hypothetical protein [Polyangiaceae bacterium]
MRRLGLDLGSSAIKAVLIDVEGTVCWHQAAPCAGSPLSVLRRLLEPLVFERSGPKLRVAVTGGSRGLLMPELAVATEVPDVVAAVTGARHAKPDTRDVLSLGGQYSFWCRLDPERPGDWVDFALSDLCAAGAGSFLEQQASRLSLTLDAFSRAAAAAKRAPSVAGRCAVFTKSDLIHLQQKGTPVDEIALGLCHALVRTFQAQVLKGRQLEPPVLLIGGCARNQGMVRAIREVFHLAEATLVVPERPELCSAVGAALHAEAEALPLARLFEAIECTRHQRTSFGTTSPLSKVMEAGPTSEPTGEGLATEEWILGVDVGSVSTNLALIDHSGRLLDCVYVKTRGRPIEAVEDALDRVAHRYPTLPRIAGVGTTGSGRHLAGHLLGADLVKNEIAAQLRAAVAFLPEADTVFEIGGQDAKYIRAHEGMLLDFTMNRVCAAGTGSFLEEQAERLGIDIIGEFADRALASRSPVDLGRRCTVFMESEAVAAMAAGASVEDVTAGLALSVARNYLDRVVGDRPIGERVVFQGGTASNRAVVAAFQSLLGRSVLVHPHHRVSGAFGVALLVRDARRGGRLAAPTRFRGFGASVGELEGSFECPQCSARCQVTRYRSGSDRFHFGDVCERYTSRDQGGPPVPDPLARRSELLLSASGIEAGVEPPANAIGLLRASHTLALLPWFAALARAAGRIPFLSPPTTTATLAAGMRHLTSDTCLPIKAAYGHAAELAAMHVRELLIPSVSALPGGQGAASSCLFGHHLPFMVAGAFVGVEVIAPELSLDLPPGRRVDALAGVGGSLGLDRRAVERALIAGDEAARRLQQALSAWGREVLDAGHDRIVVVLARPYLLSDPVLNLGLGRHLARLGLPLLPLDALPLDEVALDERWRDLPWHFARDLIRAAELVVKDERLLPVIVSSFGCGPDAFTLRHLERAFAARPHLVLELDEHRSEAGLITRIEAFADEVAAHLERRRPASPRRSTPRPNLTTRGRMVMPYFADHALGQAAILRAAGFEVLSLPPPTPAIRERGEALVSGRECHPFAMIAGDLAAWVASGDLRPNDAFFLPGTVVSCLLRQYGDGLDLLLQRLGAERIRIVMPSLDSWGALIGLRLAIRMQATLVATDVLLRARCRIRPYEVHRGETDAVYQRSLERLAHAGERGGILDALARCARDFSAIDRGCQRRPVIGVAGDVYTRINDFASDGLFRVLESAGCEVWPAPFGADLAEYNATYRSTLGWRLRRPLWGTRFALTARVITRQRRQVERAFSGIDGLMPELDVSETQALARPYLGQAANPLLVLNLGRMLRYARAGVDGILNAACINCMVGSVSQAFEARIRRDMGHLPVSTLVYGGSNGVANRTRLEAFVHQVRAHAAARQHAAGVAPSARP